MKSLKFISTIMISGAMSMALGQSLSPESDISTPAEKSGISRETPNLGQKEQSDWIRLREERKQAREEILMRLKESSTAERQNIRQDLSKNRNERPRFEGEIPKTQTREPAPFSERSDSYPMNPERVRPDPAQTRDPMGR